MENVKALATEVVETEETVETVVNAEKLSEEVALTPKRLSKVVTMRLLSEW
ncbi:hypothetical protein JJB07_17550 [Tumebacillus sp. ITR2]|uniref:Uncharacterized protein n=1 Tax=Tumebacillus amylolyticus TaxID=2801339 RepID=A0ABS1JEJ9_9BACL|nr:hypothetical protein [Tumebacillus amylolyticus]MBL0388414.1 hypothetical protein [Tumebacillus amylolyticus]